MTINDKKKQRSNQVSPLMTYLLSGGVIGLLILHPISMFVTWLELGQMLNKSITTIMIEHFGGLLSPQMLLMSLFFISIGSSIGYAFYLLNGRLQEQLQQVKNLEFELHREVESLLKQPESETLEFKSSLRWDNKLNRVNKSLEQVIMKTIAGFANHQGGSVLIGVDDEGQVLGLDMDYGTLKRKNSDGFYQMLMNLVSAWLGADICGYISVVFHQIEGKEIAQIIVSSSPRPVYLVEKGRNIFYLRTGNSTRELDVREALGHINTRWDTVVS